MDFIIGLSYYNYIGLLMVPTGFYFIKEQSL